MLRQEVFMKSNRKWEKGDYLGATVQVIPHITDEIKEELRNLKWCRCSNHRNWGNRWRYWNSSISRSCKTNKKKLGTENVMFIHVTLVPYIGPSTD